MPLFQRSRSSSQSSGRKSKDSNSSSIGGSRSSLVAGLDGSPSSPSRSGSSSTSSALGGIFSSLGKNLKSASPSKLALAGGAGMTSTAGAQSYLAAMAERESSGEGMEGRNDGLEDDGSTIRTASTFSSASSSSVFDSSNSNSGSSGGDGDSIITAASSMSGTSRRRRSSSFADLLKGEKMVYSNDYGVPMTESTALTLSKYPPKNASKLVPARHYDADPFYVPPALKDDPHALRHAEFGYSNDEWEYTSRYRPHTGVGGEEIEEPSIITYITTYISYLMLIVVGHMRDFVGKRTHRKSYQHLMPYNGYAALNSDFDSFYTRRLKARIEDLFARPVTGVAGRTITCLDRISLDHYATFRFTGLTTQALNISSYNYLGFNQSRGGAADSVEEIIKQYGVSSLGNRADAGTLDLHIYAERLIAKFLGVEDSLLISQGFATNSATLPTLVSKGCLVISDELNHASIRFGVRLSGATVRQYKHNDMKDLEHLLRESISQGQPRTHRPWKKILLVVEGLYSMEGTLVDLPRIMELKDIYKFYVYLDEAHSIGALGPSGRGVCDYFSIDPNEIDVMMGTLTKSFGAAGGYIGGSKALIAELRRTNHSNVYGEAHSPAVLMQIIAAIVSLMGREALEIVPHLAHRLPLKMLDGSEGKHRLRRLAFNSRYLSTGLRKLGFIVYGHRDSPIVPLLMFSPGKMGSFSRLMLEKFNIVTVVVAYPATPLVSSRVRFCVSAAHTKEDIDRVLMACDVIGDMLGLKLSSKRPRMSIEDIVANARQLVESE